MRSASILFSLIMALLLALPGCGKATRDSAESRFKSARDKINAAAAKNPGMKPAVDAQLIQLDKDYEVARAKTADEEAIKAISDVARRAEEFEKSLSAAPAAPAAPSAAAPPAGAPPAVAPPAPAPGGKLGGTAPPPAVPAAPAAPAMGGKLGGAAPPAAAPAPAPQGGSGFGGQ